MTGRLSFRGAQRRGICFSLALEADHPIWSRALLARSCSSHQSRSSDLESRAAGALLLLSPEQIIRFGVARCWRAPAPLTRSTLRSEFPDNYGLWTDSCRYWLLGVRVAHCREALAGDVVRERRH